MPSIAANAGLRAFAPLLSNMDFRKVVGADFPQLVDMNEQRSKGQFVAITQEIPKFGRLVREMVQYQIEAYIVAARLSMSCHAP